MSGPRWLASPVAATACVLSGLSLLAIPLRRLTSAPQLPAALAEAATARANNLPAVLRLRLLGPAQRVTLTTAEGVCLFDARELSAGVTEHDARLPMGDGVVEIVVRADFGGSAETAVFLTVMPEGHEDQTRYVIGTGRIDEPLRYEWHAH